MYKRLHLPDTLLKFRQFSYHSGKTIVSDLQKLETINFCISLMRI